MGESFQTVHELARLLSDAESHHLDASISQDYQEGYASDLLGVVHM